VSPAAIEQIGQVLAELFAVWIFDGHSVLPFFNSS